REVDVTMSEPEVHAELRQPASAPGPVRVDGIDDRADEDAEHRERRELPALGRSALRNRRFFFSSRRRHTRSKRDWSSDVCSSDLLEVGWLDEDLPVEPARTEQRRIEVLQTVRRAHHDHLVARAEAVELDEQLEIGRASCRERV